MCAIWDFGDVDVPGRNGFDMMIWSRCIVSKCFDCLKIQTIQYEYPVLIFGNIFATSIEYNINDENFLTFKTRRNRKINFTEYYDLVYQYKNDCLTAGIKYHKKYYSSGDLRPAQNLLFTVTLFPITSYEHDADDLLKNEDSFLNNLELDSRAYK